MRIKSIISTVLAGIVSLGVFLYKKKFNNKSDDNWEFNIGDGWLTWEELEEDIEEDIENKESHSIDYDPDCEYLRDFDEFGNAYFEPVCGLSNREEICHRQCLTD